MRVVRFGREAAVALHDEVATGQADDALAPVTVIVSRSGVGLATRRLLASGDLGPGANGRLGVANVRFHTIGRLADQLGGYALAQQRRLPATNAVVHAAIRAALANATTGLFGPVRTHPATERAMAAAVRDLRDVTAVTRDRLAAGSERAAQVTALTADVQQRLTGWYDEHDLIETAIGVIAADPSAVVELGRLVIYLPDRLSAIEQRFVRALAAVIPGVMLLGATGDAHADESARQLSERIVPGSSAAFPQGGTVHATLVVNAPSADAEVLVAIRGLMQHHCEGVPLERMAIVHGGADPYPRLVHEALERSAIPNNGAGVRHLSATMVGRTLLGALALADHGWRREDVLAWISGAPIRSGGAPVPATAWDLISRRAGVTAGLETWATHLAAHTALLDEALATFDAPSGEEEPEWRRRRVEQDRAHTQALMHFVDHLAELLAVESAPTNWLGWSRWADRFLREYLGDRHEWKADEEQALIEIQNTLTGLAALDDLDPDPDPATFRRALLAELDTAAPRTSRFGEGVLVGRIDAVIGLDLDVVYVVGMIEGVFPARPRDDALLPDAERIAAGDELPLRGTRATDAHRDYLAALAVAPERVVSYARGDQRRGREQRPSPWLLSSLEAMDGHRRRIFSRDVATLSARVGYRMVLSLTAAIRAPGEPTSLEDRDLRSLLVWGEHRGHLDGHILMEIDSILGLGLTARRERAGRGFSRFDGRVAGVRIPSPTETGALSATSLQDYGTCPRRYLLGKVLRLSAPERPEDIQRISARDRGSLMHEVLERFIGLQLAQPRAERLRPDQRWSAAQSAELDTIAAEVFNDYEQRGLTGRALLWELDRAAIRRDLHSFLVADDLYRSRLGVVPEEVELAFGPGRGEPVTIELSRGRRLTFKGFADRVDLADDGTAAVVDYKTGSARPYEDLSEENPVSRGTKLQLPIYGLAARSRHGAGPVRTNYWFISERGGFRTVGYDLSDPVLDRLHQTLEVMIDGIEDGLFPARPGKSDRDSFENCRYCDFDAICPSQRDRQWDRVRHAPELADYVALSEGDEP